MLLTCIAALLLPALMSVHGVDQIPACRGLRPSVPFPQSPSAHHCQTLSLLGFRPTCACAHGWMCDVVRGTGVLQSVCQPQWCLKSAMWMTPAILTIMQNPSLSQMSPCQILQRLCKHSRTSDKLVIQVEQISRLADMSHTKGVKVLLKHCSQQVHQLPHLLSDIICWLMLQCRP